MVTVAQRLVCDTLANILNPPLSTGRTFLVYKYASRTYIAGG